MSSHCTKQLAIDNLGFTAVIPDRHCDGYAIRSKNGLALTTRSTPTDPSTEDTIAAGNQKGVTGSGYPRRSTDARFPAGMPIVHVKATAPSDTLIIDYLEAVP